LASPVFTWG